MKHDGTDTNLLSATTLESQNFENSAANLVYSFQQSGAGQYLYPAPLVPCQLVKLPFSGFLPVGLVHGHFRSISNAAYDGG